MNTENEALSIYNTHVQIEITGDWKNIPVGFDWYILQRYNKDIIYLNDNTIIIKNQDAVLKYPSAIKFVSNHFETLDDGDNQKIIFNPFYLVVLMNGKGCKIKQKMSVYDFVHDSEEVKFSSCASTYYGSPMHIEYEYPKGVVGVIARYIGYNVLISTVSMFKESETFGLNIVRRYIVNGRMNEEKIINEKYDSMVAFRLCIQNINQNYKSVVEHCVKNLKDDNQSPYGYRNQRK